MTSTGPFKDSSCVKYFACGYNPRAMKASYFVVLAVLLTSIPARAECRFSTAGVGRTVTYRFVPEVTGSDLVLHVALEFQVGPKGVEEIVLPADANGRYPLGADRKYVPDRAAWTYTAPNPTDFYSVNISGAQRLPNGNTLICAGAPGFIFEVTPQNKVVWQYNAPAFGGGTGANARNVFRAYRFGPDFPGLAGKALAAGKKLEEVAQ